MDPQGLSALSVPTVPHRAASFPRLTAGWAGFSHPPSFLPDPYTPVVLSPWIQAEAAVNQVLLFHKHNCITDSPLISCHNDCKGYFLHDKY